MLFRVIGPAGSGKTQLMYTRLEECYASGKECIWICPEQQTLQYEREILARLGDGCNLSVEILNFERLPERIAREYGDLAVTYPDKGALCALLSVLVYENRKNLTEYAACYEDVDFASGLLGLFGKLRSECITPGQLKKAIEDGCFDGKRLKGKVRDIALLFEAYDAYFDENNRDMRDALTVLAGDLENKPFFRGKTVFVDGYYTFTGQEYALLAGILKQADNVYCSFTYDGRDIFEGNYSCAKKLARYANEITELEVGSYKRSHSPELVFLEQHLWSAKTPVYQGETGAVKLITAEHAFGEAEAVASEILRLVRSGMRYGDITILARNVQKNHGILDTVLSHNGIPYFFSQKEDLSSRPLAAFLLASLEIAITDCSLSSVRKYLKSGYSVLTAEECDSLLRYGESWGLKGKEWYGETPWTRNPDGYSDRPMDEEQIANLSAVNASRAKLADGLRFLRESCREKDLTGRDFLRILYTHLCRTDAAERFAEKVREKAVAGEQEQAEKDSGIWNLLMDIFDRLETLVGDKPMTAKRMLALLKLTFSNYQLGSIPVSRDAVIVGEAALHRPDGAKAVIIMGCNDGVFPAAVGRDPLFDTEEAILLENANLPVVEGKNSRMNAEQFYFYSAVASPSEQLIFTYPTGTWSGEELRPSTVIRRIRNLLPHLQPVLYTGKGAQGLFSLRNAASAFFSLPEGEQREELRQILCEKGISLPVLQYPIANPQARIPFSRNSLYLSPSKIELYRNCPFSYFGQSILKLKEKKRNRFANQESGTFLHSILEDFLRNHIVDGSFVPPVSEEALRQETDALIDAYFLRVTGGTDDKSKQFLHTCENLRKTLYLLLDNLTCEFSAGDFLPVGFEVSMGMPDSKLPAVEFTTEDGKKVYLIGSIDRVDTYHKNGITYVRVVDYKSYAKELNMSLVEQYGLDEQMLLYLFAYCRLHAKNGEVFMPAGVLYNPVKLAMAPASGSEDDAELQKNRDKQLCRTGILLEDTDVLMAMDREFSGKYVPVSLDKSGNLKKNKSILPKEEFDRLEALLEKQLLEMADKIFHGEMDVRPLKLGKHQDACHYCKFGSACRYYMEGGTVYEAE